MHMISKKDLSDAEMDTLTKSCSPTTVITANGEVQTHEEATVYVKELGIFLTMKVLENTPAVLSLGKLCDENGYSYEWINGQKPHLIKDGIRIICNTENFVPIVVPGLSSSSSGSSSALRTPMKQESHSSSSSSSSSSSPTVSEIQIREREDATVSDTSPVPVSNLVDDGSGQPDETQLGGAMSVMPLANLQALLALPVVGSFQRFDSSSLGAPSGISLPSTAGLPSTIKQESTLMPGITGSLFPGSCGHFPLNPRLDLRGLQLLAIILIPVSTITLDVELLLFIRRQNFHITSTGHVIHCVLDALLLVG